MKVAANISHLLQRVAAASNSVTTANYFHHHSLLTGFERVFSYSAAEVFPPQTQTLVVQSNTTPQTAHILSLPPELLSVIFQAVVDDGYYGWDSQGGTISYRWLRTLKVCKIWRAVALSTQRLFRFVDLTRIGKPLDVEWWFEVCPTSDLCVWLPVEPSAATTRAINLRPGVLSQVSRMYMRTLWVGSPWCAPQGLASIPHVCLFDNAISGTPSSFPALSTFSAVRDLYVTGILPMSDWTPGCLPQSLENLCIRLDPCNDPQLTNARVAQLINNLPVLRHLSLSLDVVLDGGWRQPLILPSLAHFALELFEDDYRYFDALIPVGSHSYNLDIRPYPYFDLEPNATSFMVDAVISVIKDRRGSFWKVSFDITTADSFMVLYDDDDKVVCLQVREDHALHFGRVLDIVDSSAITRVAISEGKEEMASDGNLSRCRDVVNLLRTLPSVRELVIRHEIGLVGRDTMIGLGRGKARSYFNVADVEDIVWPSLEMIWFGRIVHKPMWGLDGSTLGFIGLSLLAINAEHPQVMCVKMVKMAAALPYVKHWGSFIPKIILGGTF